MEALGVERGQQHLEAHQVFELEVAHRGLAFAELLNEPPEAIADSLPGQDVIFLDAASHAHWQEGLVAKSRERATESPGSFNFQSKILGILITDLDRNYGQ